jgi:hypothetical protein
MEEQEVHSEEAHDQQNIQDPSHTSILGLFGRET